MEITIAVLADGANITTGGNLNILGAFDRISSPRFPTWHPFMVLALRLRVDFSDSGRDHELGVTIRDEDGRVISGAKSTLGIKDIPPGEFTTANQILAFPGIQLSKPGRVYFVVTWNGEERASVPLVVVQSRPGPSA